MKKTLLVVLLLQMVSFGYEFEVPDQSAGCNISIKLALTPVKPQDQTGRAVVEVTVVNKAGAPISGKEIALTATWGTFLCKLPEDTTSADSADARSCFATGTNGKARFHLVNLPFNSPVKVTATGDCGDYTVSATGNLSIKQIKRKIKR